MASRVRICGTDQGGKETPQGLWRISVEGRDADDSSFVARQKRLAFDDEHFYVDLVFYNVILKCYPGGPETQLRQIPPTSHPSASLNPARDFALPFPLRARTR